MNRKGIYVIFIVLSAFFTVSLSSSVFAAEWLFYDDGDDEGGYSRPAGNYLAVMFTPTCSNAKILTVRFYVKDRDGSTANVRLHILASDRTTELLTPNPTITLSTGNDYWIDYDVSAANIHVSDDFYVALELLVGSDPYIGYDGDDPDGQSYWYDTTSWGTYAVDLMIRAEIDCPYSAVGGEVYNINKIAILTPYLLVVIIVLTTATVILKKRKP